MILDALSDISFLFRVFCNLSAPFFLFQFLLFHAFTPHHCSWAFRPRYASGKQLNTLKPFVCQPVLTGVHFISFLFFLISFLYHNFPPPCHPVLSIFFFSRFFTLLTIPISCTICVCWMTFVFTLGPWFLGLK